MPRDPAINISTFLMHKFQDDLASTAEFMPHDAVVGDHFEIFETNTQSEMAYDEKRVFPACYTWQSMYDMYTDDMQDKYKQPNTGLIVFKYDYFRKQFQKRYPNITLMDPNVTLFKCKECSRLRTLLAGTTDARRLLVIRYYMRLHSHAFKRARKAYALMIERALSRPDIWLSIVIDGMDQKKTMFPRLATRFELDPGVQMKFHLVGCIIHGVGFIGQLLQSEKWSHSAADMTVTTVVRALLWLRQNDKHIPDCLHLQLDNCVKVLVLVLLESVRP
jgi:hypothetical protein